MDESDRAVVISLGKKGNGIKNIVKITGYSKSFVRRWYRRGSTAARKNPGRPAKLTARVIGLVKQVMNVSINAFNIVNVLIVDSTVRFHWHYGRDLLQKHPRGAAVARCT
jgi:hypothetical protein